MFYRITNTILHRLDSLEVIELSPLPVLGRERMFMLLGLLKQNLENDKPFSEQFDSSPELQYLCAELLKLLHLTFDTVTLADFEALFFSPASAIKANASKQGGAVAKQSNEVAEAQGLYEPELNIVIGSLWHSTESFSDVRILLESMTYDDLNSLLAVRKYLQQKPEERNKKQAQQKAKDLLLRGMRSGAPLSPGKADTIFNAKGQ